jgi:RNA polymerase sigma factor (sigma-70 family)
MRTRYDLTTPGGRAAYLVDQHWDDLVRRAMGAYPSALTRSTAEDAVQEVVQAIAAGRGAAPEQPDELYAYATVAVRRTNARLVRQRCGVPLVPIPDDQRADGDTVGDHVERAEAVEMLGRILGRMPEGATRHIAALHLYSYDRDEIAAAVGVTPRRVRRVVERVQQVLQEEQRRARADDQ